MGRTAIGVIPATHAGQVLVVMHSHSRVNDTHLVFCLNTMYPSTYNRHRRRRIRVG